ncbi:DUF3237 domain-containing protein [Tenuibacillus multivorans]|uniref:UPF0311 protein SAMN05216498_1889 n=1 Tax=Tenuibacillus multivorans TaxID=237069 RepID=A0A1H0A024_9BACI|nr:DUF3237 domain-containing protein [Tenuibacillus multivorans]GEL76897.1 hypothetical protein TMU01_11320 [Tenuibacillus multivorans]SDN26263.1 Protein of unknown function [Tenuibacillus multivorans]
MEHYDAPGLKLLFDMELTVNQPYHTGVTASGNRQIIYVRDGYFRGDLLNGTVIPGGDDWMTVLDDSTVIQDLRILLKTYDGVYILMTNRGVRTGPKDVLRQIERGEEVDKNKYYFAAQPVFETSSRKYDWLNKRIFVSRGRSMPGKINYSIYTVGE